MSCDFKYKIIFYSIFFSLYFALILYMSITLFTPNNSDICIYNKDLCTLKSCPQSERKYPNAFTQFCLFYLNVTQFNSIKKIYIGQNLATIREEIYTAFPLNIFLFISTFGNKHDETL